MKDEHAEQIITRLTLMIFAIIFLAGMVARLD